MKTLEIPTIPEHPAAKEHAVPAPGPFACILVPYDGSEPSQAALTLALSIATESTKVVLVTVVDETQAIAQSATAMVAFDPTPLFDALDAQGKAVLNAGRASALKAHVTPATELVHDTPVSGVLSTIAKYGADLVVMGTHARSGLTRLFLGSTTEGVLRATTVPVITVRSAGGAQRHPLATVVLGIDDSDASDAAAALAKKINANYDTTVIACSAIDLTTLGESVAVFPTDTRALIDELHAEREAIVAASLERAGFEAAAVPTLVIDGRASTMLLNAAEEKQASAIVVGTHGRRGLQRFFLGSVAEELVRTSSIPVMVVRST